MTAFAAPGSGLAGEPGVSAWTDSPYARVRLINAGRTDEGRWRVGVEIDIQEGWKTYWRFPGESGVPPVFAWNGSRNVAAAEVHWPVPKRFIDAGLTAIGYDRDVVVPVTVATTAPGVPPRVTMQLSFGVCEEICVPLDVTASLDLGTPASFRQRLAVEDAMRQVPGQVTGNERLALVTAGEGPGAPLTVTVAPRGGELPDDVFVEGPQGWYLAVPQMLQRGDDAVSYRVGVNGLPDGARIAGAEVRVTAVFPAGAVEQMVVVAPNS